MAFIVTKPTSYPVLVAPHIWQLSPTEFTFVDETEGFFDITYATIEAAQAALKQYADEL